MSFASFHRVLVSLALSHPCIDAHDSANKLAYTFFSFGAVNSVTLGTMAPGFVAVANHLLRTLHDTYSHRESISILSRDALAIWCVCVRFWSFSWACELAGEGTLGFSELERALHWFVVNSSQCGFHDFRKRSHKGRFVWCETLENRRFEEANIRVCFAFVLGIWFLCFKFISCFCEAQQECYLSDKLQACSVLFDSQTGYLFVFTNCKRVCSISQWLRLYFECWAGHRCSPRRFSRCIIMYGEYFHDLKFSSLAEDLASHLASEC